MQLNYESWHVQLFFNALNIWDKFRGKESMGVHKKMQTNLCFYVRLLLVWTPLVIGIHVALVAGTTWATIILPIRFFGIAGYGWILAAIVGVVAILATIVGFVVLVSWIVDKVKEARKNRPKKPYTGPGFFEILAIWIMARKAQICPIIDFKTLEKEADNA